MFGGDTTSYLLARAVQLFAPGTPQIYYVGLLGGRNDMALYERTGEGCDINRHHYSAKDMDVALSTDVTRAQLVLAAVRTHHPAFAGACEVTTDGPHRVQLTWTNNTHRGALLADVTPDAVGFRVEISGWGSAESVNELAARQPRQAGTGRHAAGLPADHVDAVVTVPTGDPADPHVHAAARRAGPR